MDFAARCRARPWRSIVCCVALVLGGCGDDGAPAAGADAGRDAATVGRDAGGMRDASRPRDSGRPDAARDSGEPDAVVNCCAAIVCDRFMACDPGTCSCVHSTACCGSGECEDPAKYCDFDSCECVYPPACEPPCGATFVCDFGVCVPRCRRDGCPPATPVCADTGDCIAPACTDAACAAMSPVRACDPAAGCFDPCARGDFTWCTAVGGVCLLGTCVDASCGASTRGMANPCTFVTDCCGSSHCQHPGAPAPSCPAPCPPAEPVPTDDQCLCDIDGFCADMRSGGAL